jgi:hypothetical protein
MRTKDSSLMRQVEEFSENENIVLESRNLGPTTPKVTTVVVNEHRSAGEDRPRNRQNLVVILTRAITARRDIIPDVIGNDQDDVTVGNGNDPRKVTAAMDIGGTIVDAGELRHQSMTGLTFLTNEIQTYRGISAIYIANTT